MNNKETIKRTLSCVQTKMEKAAQRSGRSISDVTLMAVSKFHTVEEIKTVIDCGITLFGENRVQEACDKFPSVFTYEQSCDLHMIGSLQRNKVKQILPLVSCIQSVDRIELLLEIQKQAQNISKKIDVLFEVHTGEESKSGFLSEDEICRALDSISSMANPFVNPIGFMTMAPFTTSIPDIRSSFKKLSSIQRSIQQRFSQYQLVELSMGMSSDYEIAIEEGSTLVRIGTALFGARE